MRLIRRTIASAALLLSLTGFAHAQELLKVYRAVESSDDPRLTVVNDVDHPVDFKVLFADKAAWEKRADALRNQILVSNGLWPMPEKQALKPVFMTGKDMLKFLEEDDAQNKALMTEAGFVAK